MKIKINSNIRLLQTLLLLIACIILAVSASPSAPPPCDCGLEGRMAVVARAVDGDTIVLEGGERVRYIGIDTPESRHPGRPVEPFAIEAAELNRSLVEGKRVFLLVGIEPRDRFGRTLAYIFVGDVFVNARLVREGYARERAYSPNVKFRELFINLQEEAKKANKGIWYE